jgi:PKHD-type hydroxylase
MFLEVPDVLSHSEVAQIREIAKSARFLDGKITNPFNQTKQNLQLDYADQGYVQSSSIAMNAIVRNDMIRLFAFPRIIAPPLLTRYEQGMKYGVHADAPLMGAQGSALRSDISCTIFLEEPESYGGGELVIYLGSRPMAFKGRPGSAIIYPSTTLHEVTPVQNGSRLVLITFIQSQIRDAQRREILFGIGEVSALEGLRMSFENRMRLEHARVNLMRMWLD